jgi:hypothetical protein
MLQLIGTSALLVFSACFAFAQTNIAPHLSVAAYADVYLSKDFDKTSGSEKAAWLYNHKRNNEVSVNLAYGKLMYNDSMVRGNLAAMLGNYAQYNLASEPTWAQFVYEANIGVRLSKQRKIWLDAGIFPSHIGFESAISADCYTLTRSIVAENSPYYEAGAKLSYTSNNDKLNASLLYLNGWQRIARFTSTMQPCFGMQFNYKLSPSLVVNYSNFFGNTYPDSIKAFRTYHNVIVQKDIANKWGIIAGVDIGTDKNAAGVAGIMNSVTLMGRYHVNKNLAIALRGERYDDAKQIFIATPAAAFKVVGISSNADYAINSRTLFRIEAKYFTGLIGNFSSGNARNFSATTAISVKL